MKATVKGNTVIIEFTVEGDGDISASGKSRVFASTRGNKSLSELGVEKLPKQLEGLRIGLNAYKAV